MNPQLAAWRSLALVVASLVAAAKVPPLKVVDLDTGSESAMEEPALSLITDAAPWKLAFQQVAEPKPVLNPGGIPIRTQNFVQTPAIDFRKNMVVAFFAGPTLGVAGYQVAEVRNGLNDATLRLRPTPFPAAITGNPYAFVLVERTTRPIRVELDVANPGSARPQWRLLGILKVEDRRR